MLQGLECDMFKRDLDENALSVAQLDEFSEDALTSTKYRRLWAWKLREGVELPSLIAPTLVELISHFLDLGAVISRLKKTIEVGKSGLGSTSFIFVQAVSEFVQVYEQRIYQIQQLHDRRSVTLIQLHGRIGPLKAQCNFFGDLVKRSMAPLPNLDYSAQVDDLYPDRPRKSKAERTATIFKVLEDALSEVEDERCLRLVLWIFMRALEPYLEKVDRWMLYSYLSPSDRDEFCIIQTAHDHITSPIFWHNAYASIKEEVPNFLLASIQQILATGKASLLIQHLRQVVLKFSTKSHTLTTLPTQQEPLFLNSKRLFSQHFESSWNIFHPTSFDHNAMSSPLGLEVDMLQLSSDDSDSMASNSDILSIETSFTKSTSTEGQSMQLRVLSDAIMDPKTQFFCPEIEIEDSWPSSVQPMDSPLQSLPITTEDPVREDFRLANVSQLGIPISSIFHECIATPLLHRYKTTNKQLLGLLIDDCSVLSHLEAAQSIFFLEQPLSDLYSLSLLPSLWNYTTVGEVTATHWMKQLLDAHFDHKLFDYFQRASIHVIGKKPTATSAAKTAEIDEMQLKSMKKIEDVQKIWIDYEAAWPESLFINPDTHELYNSISKVLLQVLAAQYALEQLTTVNKKSTGSSAALHKMQLFRNELLLFVRSVREYMVSRVQQVPWTELEAKFRKCDDLDAMLQLHRSHLHQIRERCLLTDKFASLRKAIDRILEIAIDFSRQFQVFHTSMNPSSISTDASSFTHISQDNQVFSAGLGVDSATLSRLSNLVDRSRQEFLKFNKFLLVVLSKMSSTSIHLADLQLRLNFSGYYEL